MFITQIMILREGAYYGSDAVDPSKPFRASLTVKGQYGKIELNLDPTLSDRIVALIAEEIVAAGRATAEAMTASVLAVQALPAEQCFGKHLAEGGQHGKIAE